MQFGVLTRIFLVIHLNSIANFAKKIPVRTLCTMCMTWNFSHRIANPIQVYNQEIILI